MICIPGKVTEINLEAGRPSVEEALRRLRDGLTTCRRSGARAAVLIHGYGSTGAGGSIRTAVRRELEGPALRGIVGSVITGEQWHYRKREALSAIRGLEAWEREIANNEGITVVMLK